MPPENDQLSGKLQAPFGATFLMPDCRYEDTGQPMNQAQHVTAAIPGASEMQHLLVSDPWS